MRLKKITALALLMAICVTIFKPISAYAASDCSTETEFVDNSDYAYTYEISGEENIKNYLEEMGEPYDPNLVAVQRTIYVDPNEGISACDLIFLEYVIRNKKVSTYTDTSYLLKEYKRPAGKVSISESVSIKNTFSAESKVKAEVVEAKLGYSFSETNTFSVSWSNTYSYAVTLKVYPVYEKTTGELWEDDVWHDDKLGTFTAKRAIGDDVRVYRQ